MPSPLDRLTYAARQTARVAWYAGHYAAGRRLLKPMPKPDFPIGPTPGRAELTADMRALFEREWRDIAAGLFPAPRGLGPEPAEFLRRSLLYFRDLPQVDARRHGTLDDELPPGTQADGLPDYYRQNFHFQSDGWLSDHSAALYDTQVEVLFTGAADASGAPVFGRLEAIGLGATLRGGDVAGDPPASVTVEFILKDAAQAVEPRVGHHAHAVGEHDQDALQAPLFGLKALPFRLRFPGLQGQRWRAPVGHGAAGLSHRREIHFARPFRHSVHDRTV